MVEKYDAFFEELELEVGKFQSQGLTLDEMALQSKTVGFFPIEQTEDQDETQTLSWVSRQYKLAAVAVLKERK